MFPGCQVGALVVAVNSIFMDKALENGNFQAASLQSHYGNDSYIYYRLNIYTFWFCN